MYGEKGKARKEKRKRKEAPMRRFGSPAYRYLNLCIIHTRAHAHAHCIFILSISITAKKKINQEAYKIYNDHLSMVNQPLTTRSQLLSALRCERALMRLFS